MKGVAAVALASLTLALGAASVAAAQTPLFTDDSEIRLVIEGSLDELERRAADSTDPVPATVTLLDEAGAGPVFEIELSPRGLSRRTLGICDHPPLRLDFDKDDLDDTLFDGQNRLKLVRLCKDSDRYSDLVVLEYLAYKLYNEITPVSFRVRAAEITYHDVGGRGREETSFGFLIEDEGDLADRVGRIALDVGSGEIRRSQLDQALAARYALFQYMIGNLDWDMTYGPEEDGCCHNSKLFAAEAAPTTAVAPAPYDFDYSGFVDAPYATPPEQVPVRSVRTRYFRGSCSFAGELPAAAADFLAKRDAMLALVEGEARLSASRRRSTLSYLEDFFDTLADPRSFDRRIVRRCLD
jgi:hypothetical protein